MWLWGLILAAMISGANEAVRVLGHFAVWLLVSGLGVLVVALFPLWQLGNAQIKNLTDRLANHIGSGAHDGGGGGGKTVTLTPRTTNTNAYTPMSDQVSIPLAGRVGREWRIEATGNGDWANTPGTLVIALFIGGGLPAGLDMQVGSGDAGGTGSFAWRAVATITGRATGQLNCQLSAVVSQQSTATGAPVERINNQVAQVGASNAEIRMAITGGGQAFTARCVTESYGG